MSRVRSKNRRGRASNRSDSAQRPHITKKPMRRGPGSLAYDACEMYDVGAVERLLLKTALARRCPELNVKLDMDLPWSRLDGSFCRRYEAAAVAKRAHFNQNPFAMLKHPSGP